METTPIMITYITHRHHPFQVTTLFYNILHFIKVPIHDSILIFLRTFGKWKCMEHSSFISVKNKAGDLNITICCFHFILRSHSTFSSIAPPKRETSSKLLLLVFGLQLFIYLFILVLQYAILLLLSFNL